MQWMPAKDEILGGKRVDSTTFLLLSRYNYLEPSQAACSRTTSKPQQRIRGSPPRRRRRKPFPSHRRQQELPREGLVLFQALGLRLSNASPQCMCPYLGLVVTITVI
jgi:hypothetical protein